MIQESILKRKRVLADPTHLEIIDKLFACNVGEYISLPQLVVVGDQSSGKSSVLEGLTKLSFPRDSGLCTRFATQIIFRRDADLKEREIVVSVIPASGLDAVEVEKLRSWRESGAEILGEEKFVSMMMEVCYILSAYLRVVWSVFFFLAISFSYFRIVFLFL